MTKYSITFSTKRPDGPAVPPEIVRTDILDLLYQYDQPGATLTANHGGYWEGDIEDSYTPVVVTDKQDGVHWSEPIYALARGIKSFYQQDSIMLETEQVAVDFL